MLIDEETEKKLCLKDLDGSITDRCDRVFMGTMWISTFINYCACVALAYMARCDDVIPAYCVAYVVLAGVRGYRRGHEEYVMDRYRGAVTDGWPLDYNRREAMDSAVSSMVMDALAAIAGALVIWFAAMATYTFIVK